MASGGEATFSAAAARGTGGKLKRQTARRHTTTTPYSRPPQNQVQRSRPWISRIVDPAYRVISSGATKLLPYFFSSAASAPALRAPEDEEDQDELQDDSLENDSSGVTPSSNKQKSASVEDGGTSRTVNIKESNFNTSAQATISNRALNDVDAISELERLMEGKTFSRAETDRLIEIISSRAIDLPQVTREEKMEIPLREVAKKNVSFLDQKEDPVGDKDASIDLWATPTPLAKSVTFEEGKHVRDEAGLSPAELAKAYMGGQTTSSSSQDFVARNEKNCLDRGMLVASSGASPSCKPSACWPGVKTNEQSGFATPQSQRENFGIRRFPRTPYPRSILSGSKSQLMQLQDNSSKRLSTLQSPSQSVQTRYGQLKLSKGKDSGVFGPSRRSRQSVTMSPYSRPSRSHFENSANKSYEAGESSNLSMSQTTTYGMHTGLEVGTPTVPRHSSQIARTILDHLERTQPTPKDKSAELKLATSWRYPQSSKTVEPSSSNINNVKKDNSSAKLTEDIPNIISHVPSSSVAKVSEVTTQNAMAKTTSASNGIYSGSNSGTTFQYELEKPKDSLFGSTHEKDGAKAVSSSLGGEPANPPKPPSHSLGINNNNKRLLSSISVAKPNQRWAFPSGPNASFTFPVSSSDGATSSEPPTPSIMPFTTSTAAPSGGVGITSHLRDDEARKDDEVPQFSFGGNNRRGDKSPLVFDFPFVNEEEVMNEDDEKLGIKYTFGSKKPERISFSVAESDGVSC